MAEISSGMICGCLPAVPLFFRHAGLKIKTTFGSFSMKKSTGRDGTAGATDDSRYKERAYIELEGIIVSESQEAFSRY